MRRTYLRLVLAASGFGALVELLHHRAWPPEVMPSLSTYIPPCGIQPAGG